MAWIGPILVQISCTIYWGIIHTVMWKSHHYTGPLLASTLNFITAYLHCYSWPPPSSLIFLLYFHLSLSSPSLSLKCPRSSLTCFSFYSPSVHILHCLSFPQVLSHDYLYSSIQVMQAELQLRGYAWIMAQIPVNKCSESKKKCHRATIWSDLQIEPLS